jgi:hypothetical protein
MTTKFQVYKDKAGKFRFRLKAENSQIVAGSEAYKKHASCINGIISVKKNSNAEIEDLTIEGKKIPNPKYQVFKDAKSKFRFHLKASNGEVIAQGEGYEEKESCLNGIHVIQKSSNAEIEDLTTTIKVKEAKDLIQAPIPTPSEIKSPTIQEVIQTKNVTVTTEPVTIEAQKSTAAATVEAKDLVQTVKPVTSEIEMPSAEIFETKLELYSTPQNATKDDTLSFQGKLVRSDIGIGVQGARIDVLSKRSFFEDKLLAYGNTKEDGSFSIDWKARHISWWGNTAKIYAQFRGNEKAKPSKTNIHEIIVM